MQTYKLGTMLKDKLTGVKGMLTHLIVNHDEVPVYIFQPLGLNPETLQPVDKIMMEHNRVVGGEILEIDVPLQLLGTKAKDIASGFKGKISGLIYHINGCLHIEIKPKGILERTGATIAAHEFDIRRCEGKMIETLSQEKIDESIIENPSPEKTISRFQR